MAIYFRSRQGLPSVSMNCEEGDEYSRSFEMPPCRIWEEISTAPITGLRKSTPAAYGSVLPERD